MRLHLLAVPHTVTRSDFSHCAFTGKVQRFSPMLRSRGYDVVHYGVEGAVSGATEDVVLLSTDEHLELLGVPSYHASSQRFYGNDAKDGSPVYRQFNYALREALKERLCPGDILCLPFGIAHDAAWRELPLIESGEVAVVETGIGYPDAFSRYRVYESEAWRHWTMGREGRDGCGFESRRREWVVPNYYNVDEWPLRAADPSLVLCLGRITKAKGWELVPILARERPDLTFLLCGQGDPAPYLTEPNIEYEPPVSGEARSLLFAARASLHPSRFVEPFCGAAVEAMLSGTPVITSDFGAFTETVRDGETGRRCGLSLKEWVNALDEVTAYDRASIRRYAVGRYSMNAVAPRYDAVFQEVADDCR